VEVAAINGHVDAFSLLAARLRMENNEWFQLGQLLVLAVAGKDEEFKELLASVPVDKVSKEAVCGSTLLQDFARLGKTSAVTALLQYGSEWAGSRNLGLEKPPPRSPCGDEQVDGVAALHHGKLPGKAGAETGRESLEKKDGREARVLS